MITAVQDNIQHAAINSKRAAGETNNQNCDPVNMQMACRPLLEHETKTAEKVETKEEEEEIAISLFL